VECCDKKISALTCGTRDAIVLINHDIVKGFALGSLTKCD